MRKPMPLVVAIGLGLSTLTSSALAAEKCRLTVDERVHLDGPCNIERFRGGGFSIHTRRGVPYIVVVYVAPSGAARGYWNEGRSGSRKDTDLGDLERDGACWVNARASVCAWAR